MIKLKIPAEKYFHVTLILLLCAALLAGIYCPLYFDEITYRMAVSRLFLDHGHGFLTMPQCYPADWVIDASTISIPYRFVESVFYNLFSSPLIVREASIVKALIILYLFFQAVSRALSPLKLVSGINSFSVALLLAAFGFGVSPLLFVINRPEQELLLAVLGSVLLFFYANNKKITKSIYTDFGCILIFACLLISTYTIHPNSIFFTPFFLFVAFNLSDFLILRTLSIGILGLITLDATFYISLIVSCPQNEFIRHLFQSTTLRPGYLFTRSQEAFEALGRSIIQFPKYITNISFAETHPYNWAPAHEFSFLHSIANVFLYAIELSIFLLCLSGFVFALKKVFARKRLSRQSYLAIILFCCFFGLMILQLRKNWYSSALFLCMQALLAGLFLPEFASLLSKKFFTAWGVVIHATAFFSLSLYIWTILLAPLPAVLRDPRAYIKNNLSFSGFGYSEVSRKIWAAAAQCGFTQEKNYSRLAVDDITYWALRKNADPIDIYFISNMYSNNPPEVYADSIGSLDGFLKSRHSSGIITRCDSVLDPKLRAQGKRVEDLCCWNFLKQESTPRN